MSSCVDKRDICVIRGDTFTENAALDDTWSEVVDDPTGYTASLVMREWQDDDFATEHLRLDITPELTSGIDPLEYPVLLPFKATPTETQSLPAWDIVYYVEIKLVGAVGGTRLYEGKVKIND